MEKVKVRDVKKALRLCNWGLMFVDGDCYQYRHPAVFESITIKGRDNDFVSRVNLEFMERQLGLSLRSVLA